MMKTNDATVFFSARTSLSAMTARPRRTAALLGMAATGALALTAPAWADPAPPAPAEFSWTGVHVGAFVGKTTNNGSQYGPDGTFGAAASDSLHASDVTYGGDIGYDRQLGKWFVLGVSAGLHGTKQSAGASYTGGEGYAGLASQSRRHTFGGEVAARAGVAVGHVLAYGKVGLGFDKFDYTAVTADNQQLTVTARPQALRPALGNPSVVYTGSRTRTGVLVGGGLEFAVMRHVSLIGEYDHVGYSASTMNLAGGDGSTLPLALSEHVDTVRFGIRYRF